MKAYVRYRIAGGRMKFKEFDTGNEQHYTRFPGIELEEIGSWCEDRNNIAPCEWTMSDKAYIEWFHSTHPKPVDICQATRLDAKCFSEGNTQLLDPTRNSYRAERSGQEAQTKMATTTSLTQRTPETMDHYIVCT